MIADGTHGEVQRALQERLLQAHGFRVVSNDGQVLGSMTNLWTDGDVPQFLGLLANRTLQSARPVPCTADVRVDFGTATVYLPHSARTVQRAPRLRINHALTPASRLRICRHYGVDLSDLPVGTKDSE